MKWLAFRGPVEPSAALQAKLNDRTKLQTWAFGFRTCPMFLGLTSLVYLREVARSFRSLVALWQSGTESQGTEDVFSSAIRLLSGRFLCFR